MTMIKMQALYLIVKGVKQEIGRRRHFYTYLCQSVSLPVRVSLYKNINNVPPLQIFYFIYKLKKSELKTIVRFLFGPSTFYFAIPIPGKKIGTQYDGDPRLFLLLQIGLASGILNYLQKSCAGSIITFLTNLRY